MSFGTGDWTQLILDAVEPIADRNCQERSWFDRPWLGSPKGYREISSPNEDLSRLFDDLDFDDYLRSPGVTLSEEQRRLGLLFRDKLHDFSNDTPQFLNPAEVIDDPRWVDIRKAAGAFADALRKGKEAHREQ